MNNRIVDALLSRAGMGDDLPPHMGGMFRESASPQSPSPAGEGTRDLLTALMPGVGDIVGPIQDAQMFAFEPSSRTPLNYGLAGLGALPFLPSLGGILRLTRKSAGVGVPLSASREFAPRGSKLGRISEAAEKAGAKDLTTSDLLALREDYEDISRLRFQREQNKLGAAALKDLPDDFGKNRLRATLEGNRADAARQAAAAQRNAVYADEVGKLKKFADSPLISRSFADKIKSRRASDIGSQVARQEYVSATLEAVPRVLKKSGWTMRHASVSKDGRKSSRYLVSPDRRFEVRLSDHHLPDTQQRSLREFETGRVGRWSGELIVSGDRPVEDVIDEIVRMHAEAVE